MKISTKIALVAALFTMSFSAQSQCAGVIGIKNGSQDVWRISYYNNDVVVQPGTSINWAFFGGSPNIGRGVILEPSTSPGPIIGPCSHKFQNNPDIWNAPCAPGTVKVTYNALLDPYTGCYNYGTIRIE